MATKLSTFPQGVSSDLSANDSSALFPIGAKVVSNDGREFVYAKVGAVATVAGTLLQSPAEVANHQNMAPAAAAAIGDKTLSVTLGATAATADQYAGGWAVVSVTPGVGRQYKISSHPAHAGSGTLVLTLEDPIAVALTTANSKVDLVANPFNGVLINPASASGAPVGAAVSVITATYCGWIQTRGPANLLANGNVTVGTNLCGSNAVAGAVEPQAGVQAFVGVALATISDTEYGAVNLLL